MKRVFVVLFAVVMLSLVGAEPLTGFWGIPWGKSMPEVEAIVQTKGFRVAFKNDTGMLFKNVTFANRTGDAAFIFKDQKFSSGSFIFTPMKTLAYESFQSLKKDLLEKYGPPKSEKEQYIYPYTKESGHKETAISINYLIMEASWLFDEGNVILLSIKGNEKENKIEITLSYYFGPAYEQMVKETKKSALDDL